MGKNPVQYKLSEWSTDRLAVRYRWSKFFALAEAYSMNVNLFRVTALCDVRLVKEVRWQVLITKLARNQELQWGEEAFRSAAMTERWQACSREFLREDIHYVSASLREEGTRRHRRVAISSVEELRHKITTESLFLHTVLNCNDAYSRGELYEN